MSSPADLRTQAAPPAALGSPRIDVVTYLSLWIALLFGISALQIFGPLGAIGQPALMLVMPTLLFWLAGWLLPDSGLSRASNPMRLAVLLYLWYGGMSYAVAMARPLTELENSGAHRALIMLLAFCGLALLVTDGVEHEDRLTVLLRRVMWGATFLSVIGILQFFTGSPFQFRLPGLQWLSGDLAGVGGRSDFNRPRGTARHPIEFSVVTAAMLPIALHFAFYDSTISRRRNAATCAVVIGFAMPLSISRSGIVSVVVALGVLALGWSWRRRLYGLVVAGVAVPLLWVTIPGLVGTLRSMFMNTEHDPSVQARRDRVPRIMELIRERPWFGRGNGTWSTQDYFLIDNEMWVTTLEQGIVGIVLTFALFVFGVLLAISIRSLPGTDERTGHLGRVMGASIAGLATSLLTFDAFHYHILTGSLFLLLGCVGALWRMQMESRRRWSTPPG